MILCVNLNAAIDKTITVADFTLNNIHRPQAVLALPGGKGVNVARVLKTLGEDVILTGWVGGHAGQFIEAGLQAEGIRTAFAHTVGESRTCLSILDPARNTLTEIYEKGDPIPEPAFQNLLGLFAELLPQTDLVTLSGSLPPGAPPDTYAQLSAIANRQAVPVFLDSSGEALCLGLQSGHISLVKPNRHELRSIIDGEPGSVSEIGKLAAQINNRSGAAVVVSLGEEGLVAARDGRVLYARPPAIELVSAVGSGDATLAGLAVGHLRKLALEETLSLAVAAGAANAMTVGAGRLSKSDLDRLRSLVRISDLSALRSHR